jgi:succinate-acetate transporter protein
MNEGLSTVRVFLRPLGSPLTIGMSGLAIASFVQSGLDLHWVALSQTRDVGLILVSVPFLLQLISSVFSYLVRDGAAGAAIGVLAGTWLTLGLLHLSSAPGARSGALGLMLLAAGGMVFLSSVAIALGKPIAGGTFALVGVRFVVAGVYQLGAAGGWEKAAGIIGLVIVALAAYNVIAFELEGVKHHAVLPTFRRGRARAAISGLPAAQLADLTAEPGVRETS